MTRRRFDSFDAPSRRRLRAFGAGYTLFVRLAKIILPLTALVIVGLVISRMNQSPEQHLTDAAPQAKTTPGQIDLVQAKYEGTDAQGRAYVLSATHASRDMGAEQAVLLDNPSGYVTLQDGSRLAAFALHGRYNNKDGTLQLQDAVTLTHASDYVMHLRAVTVALNARTAVSTQPVSVTGAAGTLEAASLDIANKGMLVTFGGPVTLTLTAPHKQRTLKETPG